MKEKDINEIAEDLREVISRLVKILKSEVKICTIGNMVSEPLHGEFCVWTKNYHPIIFQLL